MAGMGLTMEGINQNYIVYQYLIDLAWTEEELDPQPWYPGSFFCVTRLITGLIYRKTQVMDGLAQLVGWTKTNEFINK